MKPTLNLVAYQLMEQAKAAREAGDWVTAHDKVMDLMSEWGPSEEAMVILFQCSRQPKVLKRYPELLTFRELLDKLQATQPEQLASVARSFMEMDQAKGGGDGMLFLPVLDEEEYDERPQPAIYQLRVALKGIKPPIWRRVLVRNTITLPKLHEVIQAAMGWDDYHLHSFSMGRETFSIPDADSDLYGSSDEDERKVQVRDVLDAPGQTIRYTYDFGDNWEHEIKLEKIVPKAGAPAVPTCIAGKRACPPEDCGGAWGYQALLAGLADPAHPEHAMYEEWHPEGIDAEAFNLEEVDARVATLRTAPRAKKK